MGAVAVHVLRKWILLAMIALLLMKMDVLTQVFKSLLAMGLVMSQEL